MYTEMLEGGMVSDASQRQNYLSTLRAEADRLGHLVENVLAYSRLERNRAGYQVTTVKLGDVLGRAVERLSERARHAGMELVASVPADVGAATVRTNALALEQILFNLVDNACKYAGAAADKRVELTAAAEGRVVAIRVRDHGPGIPPAQAARLFRPFSKTAQEAANTAPGLGLGLALSRRLAQSMGGDLSLDQADGSGAKFVVALPRA
jgi:signal transduction histidine kinase